MEEIFYLSPEVVLNEVFALGHAQWVLYCRKGQEGMHTRECFKP